MAEINYQNSKYKRSPEYSFNKARKFNYKTYYKGNQPGPGAYNPEIQFKNLVCQKIPKYSFPRESKNYFKIFNRNPGPNNYYLPDFIDEREGFKYGRRSFTNKRKGIRFGYSRRFKDDENFMENLFLPINYS